VIGPRPPIRDRQVIVDRHEIDMGRGPEQIEVEKQVARAVRRPVRVIFRPVGRVGDQRRGQDPRHVRRQVDQAVNKGIVPRARFGRLREADRLGPDQEGVDPAGGRRQMGKVQDEAPIAPFGRPRVGDCVAVDIEVRDLGRAQEGGDFVGDVLAGGRPNAAAPRILALQAGPPRDRARCPREYPSSRKDRGQPAGPARSGRGSPRSRYGRRGSSHRRADRPFATSASRSRGCGRRRSRPDRSPSS
jgi:hypothetical protein